MCRCSGADYLAAVRELVVDVQACTGASDQSIENANEGIGFDFQG